jgi:hypothetical protein
MTEAGRMVGDRALDLEGFPRDPVLGVTRRLADAFDEAGGEHALAVHLDELVLERRGAAVDDEDDGHVSSPVPGWR